MMRFQTLLLSLLHLLVDGVCACGMMIMTHQPTSSLEAGGMIILYNLLAFGTQPLTGRWVDHGGARPQALILAVTLLIGGALVSLLATFMSLLTTIAGTILLGMGNSLFHVYGGKYVAVASHTDIRAMGVFVSPGAVGLAIGIGFSSPVLLAVLTIALLALSALHLRKAYGQHGWLNAERSSRIGSETLILCCLMLVVACRAFVGESVPSLRIGISSLGSSVMMVMVSCIVMMGKAAGGFLSRCWGVWTVFILSVMLSGICWLMCPWHDGFVLLTLLLINLSMPCTLYWATKAVPGREGWAFGLLAMALLFGSLYDDLVGYIALLL